MRKIVVSAFLSLDGVMQGPGGPDEDTSGSFRFGGWLVPLSDDAVGAAMGETFSAPFELLLGRKTYDIWAAHWPFIERDPAAKNFDAGSADLSRLFDRVKKYVATHRPESLSWQNSESLGSDPLASLRKLKQAEGPRLMTQGSTELIHLLLQHDLVDELRLITFPVVLGQGKRLFSSDAVARTFRLSQSAVSPKGVVIANYEKVGGVETGSFALQEPTPQELERRKNWK